MKLKFLTIICTFIAFTIFCGDTSNAKTESVDYNRVSNNANGNHFAYDGKGYIYYPDWKDAYGIIKESIKNPKVKKELVKDQWVGEVFFHNGWIYYNDLERTGSLFRVKSNGTSKKQLSKKRTYYLNEYKGSLYYNVMLDEDDDNSWYIQKMNLKTKKVVNLKKLSVNQVQVVNGLIYMVDGDNQIFKMKVSGKDFEELKVNSWNHQSYFSIDKLMVVAGEVYYRAHRGDFFALENDQVSIPVILQDSGERGRVGPNRIDNPDQVISYIIRNNDLYYILDSYKEDGTVYKELWHMNRVSKVKNKLSTLPFTYLSLYLAGNSLYIWDNNGAYKKILTLK
ncbi:DUF5050 domain-containing protein [Bacillus sp. 31A1R]|uniref:DUF5050 domain-containing protein n=1 Tax=Robertmurraya mangrovi TaxID=3098077 RepID=A0ABU5IXK5_9BACI|nr:DUF5050 domain-containing protein [Bacillus sp. 31A1R]MDZ5471879.1 DUF5050 domain-containing protein [Bacillus sp. 31A1R]